MNKFYVFYPPKSKAIHDIVYACDIEEAAEEFPECNVYDIAFRNRVIRYNP